MGDSRGTVLARRALGLVAAGSLGWFAVGGVRATADQTSPAFDARWRHNHEQLECLGRRLLEAVAPGTAIYSEPNGFLHQQRFAEWSIPDLQVVLDEADADVRVAIVNVPGGACRGQDVGVTELR